MSGLFQTSSAVLKSNLIRSIEFGTAVARRLKRVSVSDSLQLKSPVSF